LSTSRVIARNILSNWTNLAVSIVIGFLLMPFMVSRLGDTLYGIWILVVSLVGYGNLLDLGVRTSIVKYVSQHHATEDRDRLRGLFTTTLATYTAIGGLVLILTAAVALSLLHLFRVPPEMEGEARLVLLIVGLSLALKFPGGVFEGFLAGLQRYELVNGIVIGSNLLRAGLTVVVLVQGEKLLALAAVGLVCDLLMTVVMAVVCRRLLPWLSLRRRNLSREVLRQVYTFGVWSSIIALSSRILYDSDAILIGMFLPAAAITHFAVANNLVRYLRQLAHGYGNVFNPAASDLEARGEQERLAGLLTQGTRYASAVVLPAAVLVALLGRDFLALWMGPRFAGESGTVLIILVLSQAASMAQFPAGAMLYGLNRHRQLAFVILGEALMKVTLSLVLLRSYGILGAAVGTAIPEILGSLLLVPVLVTRWVGVPLGRYMRQAFLPPLASILPAGALVLGLRTVAPPTSWGVLVVEVAAGLLFYGAMVLRFCLDGTQRATFSATIRRKFRRAAA
jgi:O-antigen/teichoic acid export membrane protein